MNSSSTPRVESEHVPAAIPKAQISAFVIGLGFDLLYLALLIPALPWLLYVVLIRKRGVGSLRERFGGVSAQPAAGPRVWVHAVSVGELEAALPLIAQIEEQAPGVEVVVSTTTTSAQRLAKQRLPQYPHFLFPLDFGLCVRRALRRVRPDLILLVELELWPNMVLQSAARGIPVAIVNGRMSQRGADRMQRVAALLKPLFRRVRQVLVQNEEYSQRFARVGVPTERLRIAGNLKFDRQGVTNPEAERQHFDQLWGWSQRRWIAGCTHPGEEERVRDVHKQLCLSHAPVKLLVAPRHVERSSQVAEIFRQEGWRTRLYSEGPGDAEVVVVDVNGQLATLYACADAAFVGGSWVPRGGHNMLEPVAVGTPTAHGPFTGNFRQIVDLLQGAKATEVVEDSEALVALLRQWWDHPGSREQSIERGREVLSEHRGAAARSARSVLSLLR